jgi:hypothetical protein
MDKQSLFLGRTDQGIFAQGLFCSMEKVAGVPGAAWETAPAIRSFIRTLAKRDRDRNCYVLVNALGAGEYFGSNINADYFPWDALSHEGDDYGYKTFLNAHAFAHHANKDPLKAFGTPAVSVLNPRMKRVELVIKLDREKAKTEGADAVIHRIDGGEFPDVSMGCRVPFDICMYCGHRSKTRDDYCIHMRPPPELRDVYGPNKILPDGTRICVINTLPRFFDISFVFIGADKTAKVMAKLASRGNQLCMGDVCAIPTVQDRAAEVPALYGPTGEIIQLQKQASPCEGMRGSCGRLCSECSSQKTCHVDKLAAAFGVRKQADIEKDIPAGTFSARKLPEIEAKEKDLPREVLDALADRPLPDSTGAATAAGIVLKPAEFQRIVLIRLGIGDVADELDDRHLTFRPVNEFDDSVSPELPSDGELLHMLLPFIMARSAYRRPLQLRAMKVPDQGGTKKTLPTRGSIEHPVLDKISAAYNGYRRNVLTMLSQAGEEVLSDPQLRSAVLGNELVDMFVKTASQHPIIDIDTVAYMMGAHLSNRSLLSTTAVAVAHPWLREEPAA